MRQRRGPANLLLTALVGLVMGACAPKDDGAGAQGSDAGSGTESETGEVGSSTTAATTEYLDCGREWEWVEFQVGSGTESWHEPQEATVLAWSDSSFRLSAPGGTFTVTWPPADSYATEVPAEGETVIVADLSLSGSERGHYVVVTDTGGHLLWEGGNVTGGPEDRRLDYTGATVGERCLLDGNTLVVPSSVEATVDENATAVSGEAQQVTISGEPYVFHVLSAERWIHEPGECADCPDHTASAYLARLE